MKSRKTISAIIIIFMLFYFIFSLIPVGIMNSYAAGMAAGTLSPDINAIDENLYPGYKSLINALQAKYPNYRFLAYYTGMDWNEVLNAEYQGHGSAPLNLFQVGTNYNGIWMCPICGNKSFDNGSWCCASKEALAYMMDPRNSINESDIFQFKDLEGSDVSYNDIARVVANYGAYLNNPEAIQAIVDASVQYNVNGYFLVAKIVNEHGKDGSTLSNGQGYNGSYIGVYNYFNIGSFGNGTDVIIKNGLDYAQASGWNSIRASILGGTAVVKESYITEYSQNTLYYQKFNVSGKSPVGSHQYQQNIMAAQSQGTSLKSYYGTSNTVQTYTFIIPLYENMPIQASLRPDTTKTNTIAYEDGIIKNVSSVLTVRAATSINSLAIGKLNGEENIKILQRATGPSADGYYWDLIVSNVDGTYGYAARYVKGDECIVSLGTTGSSSGTNTVPNNPPSTTPSITPDTSTGANGSNTTNIITGITGKVQVSEDKMCTIPNMTCDILKTNYAGAVVKNLSGQEVTTGKIGTGYTVTINSKAYTIVKKGDINGDGNANISDAISILNYLKGTNPISGVNLEAAKINGKSNVTISDAVLMLNYLKGSADLGV